MKRHSMPEMKEGGVNVTPLIDIVMCLIIFFMLVAKIGVARSDDQVDLPTTIMGNLIKDMSNTLTLNLHTPANPESPGQITTVSNGVPLQLKLGPELDSVLKKFADPNSGIKNPRVIIRADQDLPYSQLEPVLLAIQRAGIQNTAYETNQPKNGESQTIPQVEENQ